MDALSHVYDQMHESNFVGFYHAGKSASIDARIAIGPSTACNASFASINDTAASQASKIAVAGFIVLSFQPKFMRTLSLYIEDNFGTSLCNGLPSNSPKPQVTSPEQKLPHHDTHVNCPERDPSHDRHRAQHRRGRDAAESSRESRTPSRGDSSILRVGYQSQHLNITYVS